MKWMISANGQMYDHAAAFARWGYIDWRQRARYAIGDEVYIYCTKPYQKVMYKTIVRKIGFTFSECTDDKEYWKDLYEYEKAKEGQYARLELIEQVDSEALCLQKLQQHGLKVAPQGPIRIVTELAEYLDQYVKDDYEEGVFPEVVPQDTYEGAVKKTMVNKYERSSIARRKCIEKYGCRCYICGMSFEEKYGEIGKGFIHVHHIVPLNKISKEYRVNYETDLIPVCPNCHAMLHRTINGSEVSVDELKRMINKNQFDFMKS